MDYKVVYLNDYYKEKQIYISLINKMFKEDNDKLANLQEISNHLDFIFNADYNQKAFLILQIENDELVSMINGYEYDNIRNEWCLFSLFTKKEKRKLGYGEKILKRAIEKIKKYNCSKIIVGIEKKNIPSIKLHEKAGFEYSNCNCDDLADGFPENHLGYCYKIM